MKTIVAIDFSAIYFRAALFSGPDTPIGEARKASIETIDRIHSLLVQEKHKILRDDFACIICCDSKTNWRKKADPTYKANRERQPDSFYVEMDKTKERLKADGYLLIEEDGYEADDVIASVCKAADPAQYEVIVCSPDKDLLQLVGPGVKQLRTHDMFMPDKQTLKLWDETLVLDTFGVKPDRLADYLAIVGDDTDNIVGIQGVGGKGAATLLNEFGSLKTILICVEGLMTTPDPISPFSQKSLARWKIALDRFFLIKPKEACDTLDKNRLLTGLKSDLVFKAADFFLERKVQDISSDSFEKGPMKLDAPEMKTDFIDIGVDEEKHPGEPTAEVTALTKADPMSQFDKDLNPTGMAGLWWLANRAVNSRLFEKFGSPERALMAMGRGKDYGMSPFAAMEMLQVIDGKICPPAVALNAMIQRHPDCVYWYVKDVSNRPDNASATAVGCRRLKDGTKGPEQAFTYTIEDARLAKLVKPNSGWEKNPGAQCVARATSWLGRWMFPDATTGAYSWEEMEGERQ